MGISFIVAMDANRGIGKDNQLPWRLPADLAYVKKLTMGNILLMGRKTYESIGRPLPGRTNVVLTQNPDFAAEGCETVHSVQEALERYGRDERELFIFGGSEIFKLFFPYAEKLYITRIEHAFETDTFFPEYDESEWRLAEEEDGIRDEKNPYVYKFQLYERIGR